MKSFHHYVSGAGPLGLRLAMVAVAGLLVAVTASGEVLPGSRPMHFQHPGADLGSPSQFRTLELGHRDTVVTFELADLDYAALDHAALDHAALDHAALDHAVLGHAALEANTYRYKLEGFDKEWIDLGSERRITYTNLSPGRYLLKVAAANSDGTWSPEGLTLPVIVRPAPWQTWWARLGYLLLLIAGVGWFLAGQKGKLARQAEYSAKLEEDVRMRTRDLAVRAIQLEEANRRLFEVSLTDALTGLWNRRYLCQRAAEEVALVRRRYSALPSIVSPIEITDLGLLMIDLDEFKTINDTYGHQAGDEVLLYVRDVLSQVCRTSDVLARWGGDEFVVMAREVGYRQVEALAERIRFGIAKTFFKLPDSRVVRITCSIGFATFPLCRSQPAIGTWEDVLALADAGLYVAKRSGRNAWVGLSSAGRPLEQDKLRFLRSQPEQLVNQGYLRARSSKGTEQGLAWA